ncbi:MAG: SpoIID/LytB domain-containing protein [Polyangia bacterium]|jgi:hypothetical protein|nr:SpoIID/LytB domain-containing protein [Polyangia bacterium]
MASPGRRHHGLDAQRRRELRRQWLAAGAVSLLALVALGGLYLRQRLVPPLRGPFPARPLNDIPISFDPSAVPGALRVLRTGKPYRTGKCSALYRGHCVETIVLERYVQGVVSGEEGVFHRAIHIPELAGGAHLSESQRRRRVAEAWKLQAVAARSYALYAVLADKYRVKKTGFHITDTPWDQVYTDRRSELVDAAVGATRGQVLVDRRGRLLHALYSASCGGRGTRSVLKASDRIECHPDCGRHEYRRSSHYVGMCQWGSLLFAMEGHDLGRLVGRYYPGARLQKVTYKGSR